MSTTPEERGILARAIDRIHAAHGSVTAAADKMMAAASRALVPTDEREREALIVSLEAELEVVTAQAPKHVQVWARELRARLDAAPLGQSRASILAAEARALSEGLHRVTERTEGVRAEVGTEAAAT